MLSIFENRMVVLFVVLVVFSRWQVFLKTKFCDDIEKKTTKVEDHRTDKGCCDGHTEATIVVLLKSGKKNKHKKFVITDRQYI